MAKLVFRGLGRVIEFDPAQAPFDGHGRPASVLDIARAHGVPLPHDCGGVCLCTACRVTVVEGADQLSEKRAGEVRRLQQAPASGPRSRLGCQAVVLSNDAVVEVELEG